MSSFNKCECLGYGQPCDGLYCYPCTCRQCGIGLTNGICLNFTYRDGKPLNCCKCEGPLRGGFCWFCASKAETSFANDPNPNSFYDSQNLFDYSPQLQNETYPCKLCGNDSHYGYDCPSQFPFVYEQQPCYNQNFSDNYYPHNSSSLLCYDNCRGPHESFQCKSMDQNYFKPNPCYDCNSSSFGQFEPSQYFDVHQPFKEISIDELKIMMQSYCERMNQQRAQEALLAAQREQELLTQEQAKKEAPPQNFDFRQLIGEEVKNIVEQPTKRGTRIAESLQNFRVVHKKSSISLKNTSQFSPVHAITPILPTEEPEYSRIMGYEHLSTIPETESDEVTESSAKNLVPIPSEYEEFSGKLAHINPILPGIKEADFDLEEEIRFVENLLYDNSSPRPPKELNAEIADTIIESLSQSPIPVEDNDSLLDEIDLFLATDELLPPNIESDNYDSEGDIHFLEELLVDDSIPLLKNESSIFDHDNLSFPRPLPKTPDVESFFDLEPNSREVISVVMNNIDEFNEDECFDP
nr:hypothetical protein [Tanacetum cinerariifolium]GEZ68471.1 hypothetical protein [Tanacetum cinerariifolium]